MDFKQKIKEYAKIVDENLDILLPPEDTYPQNLYKAMRYSIFAGGKRLRPILALSACELFERNIEDVMTYACAIEMLHTWSLIHDDLPAIDNDDYRRGKLTNHKVFGEATAVLAGDALLSYAAEIMLRDALNRDDNDRFLRATYEIISSSGAKHLISGELVDIESEGKQIDHEVLQFMYYNKTSKMIIAPLRVGAIIAGASQEQIDKLTEFAENIGLAFQIRDDILDIIGDQEKLGKDIGSDQENDKSTYVSIYGLEKAKLMVEELSQNAIKAFDIFGDKATFLVELADYLVNRES